MSNVIALPTSPTTRDPARIVRRPVAQSNETRRVDAAAANRERGGGADRGQLRWTQHLDFEIGLLCHGLGAARKLLWSQRRGGFIAEVAGQVHTPRHSGCPSQSPLSVRPGQLRADESHRFNVAAICRVGGSLSAVLVEAIEPK